MTNKEFVESKLGPGKTIAWGPGYTLTDFPRKGETIRVNEDAGGDTLIFTCDNRDDIFAAPPFGDFHLTISAQTLRLLCQPVLTDNGWKYSVDNTVNRNGMGMPAIWNMLITYGANLPA